MTFPASPGNMQASRLGRSEQTSMLVWKLKRTKMLMVKAWGRVLHQVAREVQGEDGPQGSWGGMATRWSVQGEDGPQGTWGGMVTRWSVQGGSRWIRWIKVDPVDQGGSGGSRWIRWIKVDPRYKDERVCSAKPLPVLSDACKFVVGVRSRWIIPAP